MKRLNGPELKMPDLKAPAFVADLYHDLRDRRLLPLVALVLVAIVATPLLLGQKSEATPSPAGAGAIAALRQEGGRTSQLTVVEATPGLRDYRKRLRGRKPTDPFRQASAASGSKGGGGSAATTSESSTSTSMTSESSSSTSTSVETSPSPTTAGAPSGLPADEGGGNEGGSGNGGGGKGGGGNGGDQGGGASPHATLYSFAVDLTIVHTSGSDAGGDKKAGEPETRKHVLPTTILPGAKTQVVTYMGISPKTKKPFFLVSPEVSGVFGEGKCAAGTGTCQLIEMEPGFPEVFEYGEAGDRYKITITKVELTVIGHT